MNLNEEIVSKLVVGKVFAVGTEDGSLLTLKIDEENNFLLKEPGGEWKSSDLTKISVIHLEEDWHFIWLSEKEEEPNLILSLGFVKGQEERLMFPMKEEDHHLIISEVGEKLSVQDFTSSGLNVFAQDLVHFHVQNSEDYFDAEIHVENRIETALSFMQEAEVDNVSALDDEFPPMLILWDQDKVIATKLLLKLLEEGSKYSIHLIILNPRFETFPNLNLTHIKLSQTNLEIHRSGNSDIRERDFEPSSEH